MANEATKRKTIFIVDDDTFLLGMYSLKFRESGFGVETSTDGADAFERMNDGSFHPDVVLLDLVMPNVDGFEFLEKMQAAWKADKSAVVIVLSNLGEQADIRRALSLGADGYIVKASSTPSEVVERVARAYEEKKKK